MIDQHISTLLTDKITLGNLPHLYDIQKPLVEAANIFKGAFPILVTDQLIPTLLTGKTPLRNRLITSVAFETAVVRGQTVSEYWL